MALCILPLLDLDLDVIQRRPTCRATFSIWFDNFILHVLIFMSNPLMMHPGKCPVKDSIHSEFPSSSLWIPFYSDLVFICLESLGFFENSELNELDSVAWCVHLWLWMTCWFQCVSGRLESWIPTCTIFTIVIANVVQCLVYKLQVRWRQLVVDWGGGIFPLNPFRITAGNTAWPGLCKYQIAVVASWRWRQLVVKLGDFPFRSLQNHGTTLQIPSGW